MSELINEITAYLMEAVGEVDEDERRCGSCGGYFAPENCCE